MTAYRAACQGMSRVLCYRVLPFFLWTQKIFHSFYVHQHLKFSGLEIINHHTVLWDKRDMGHPALCPSACLTGDRWKREDPNSSRRPAITAFEGYALRNAHNFRAPFLLKKKKRTSTPNQAYTLLLVNLVVKLRGRYF